MIKIPRLAIVVPCYNEEEVFSRCLSTLIKVISELRSNGLVSGTSYILFVDDGSHDSTWSLIEGAAKEKKIVKGVKLSRNRGHQTALVAGLQNSNSDIVISIDADLQDDTSIMEVMVHKFWEGYEIVYGVRNDRHTDSRYKRNTANFFYSVMSWMGVQQVPHHADFRLLSRRAKDALLSFKEQNIYLRGLLPLVGFKATEVVYSRSARVAGESKYPLKKMIALAIDGITSLTVTPLRLISCCGFLFFFLFILSAVFALFQKINGNTVAGWTSIMIVSLLFGGIQMLSLGVIGEYVGKIYLESKARPKYFIEEKIGEEDEE